MTPTVHKHPIEWVEGTLWLLDQTRLPQRKVFLQFSDYQGVVEAIKQMRVRGAPAIGIAAAYGIALGAQSLEAKTKEEFVAELEAICQSFSSTRPTAVNLFKAVGRMKRAATLPGKKVDELQAALVAEAKNLHREEEEAMRRLSQLGAELIKDGFSILTHCNTGALATGTSYGTALGIIKWSKEQGKRVSVLATETRPLLQGARLTAWELKQENIPTTLITDSMAGYFMKQRRINCVVVGADRIAANGDVANKIGSYALAVLAMEHGIPFYVACPTSSIDLSIPSGDQIPVEERSPDEVTRWGRRSIAPRGVKAANPAFDITPSFYITAIITEKGIVREPYEVRLRKMLE